MLGNDYYQSMGESSFPDVHPSAHTLWGIVFDYMNWSSYALLPDELWLINREHGDNPKNPFGI